jgi:Uma2 family endonuclease
MVVRPHASPLTVEEYKNLPETGPRYQLIEGDLYLAPAPNRFHHDISRNLQGHLIDIWSQTRSGSSTTRLSMSI